MAAVDAQLFSPDLVFFDIEAKDAFELFDKLEARLAPMGYIRDTWKEAISERERSYPTGLACEAAQIAIPHTDPVHIAKPYIAVVRPSEPIAFQPMGGLGDEVKASIVINLGILRDGGQVQVLQSLMGIFMDEQRAAEVLRQVTKEGLIESIAKYFVDEAK